MMKRQFIKAPLVQNNETPIQGQPLSELRQTDEKVHSQQSEYNPVSSTGIGDQGSTAQQILQNAETPFFANRTIPQGFMVPGQQAAQQAQTGMTPFFDPARSTAPPQSAASGNLFTPAPQPRGSQTGITPQPPVGPWSQSGITPGGSWSQSGITPQGPWSQSGITSQAPGGPWSQSGITPQAPGGPWSQSGITPQPSGGQWSQSGITPQPSGGQWSQSGITSGGPGSQSGITPQPPGGPGSQSGITPLLNPSGSVSPHQSLAGIDVFASEDINTLPVPAVQRGPVSQAGIPQPGNSTSLWQTDGFAPMGGAMQPMPPWAKTALKRSKKRRFPIWARVVVALFAVLVAGGGSAFAYYQVNYASAINNITGQQAYHLKSSQKDDGNAKQAVVTNTNTNTNNVLAGGRINILLLGSDTDGKDGNDIATGTPLAQTDMIITIDPQTKYVGMLSIPRDLQVYIPGYSNGDKMDKAFLYGVAGGGAGAVAKRVGYGAGLAEDTIQANFGIKINYYAWVDIYGFAKVVDTAGGVDIDATHPIVDNSYPDENNKKDSYAYKRLYIAPGPQHMDGDQALEYVRSRHADLVGDIGRTARQQQLLSALKQKLANPNVIAEAPQLLKDMNGSIFTDMQPDQIIQIANYARGVDLNKVDRVTLGPPTYAYASPNPQSTNLLPYCDPIRGKLAQMFGSTSQVNCISQAASSAPASNNSTALASITPPTGTSNGAITQAEALLYQTLPDLALSLSNTYSVSDSTHGLLDLLFFVVFQSFDALQL
jgi:LCP family protein required for cell wall assembly